MFILCFFFPLPAALRLVREVNAVCIFNKSSWVYDTTAPSGDNKIQFCILKSQTEFSKAGIDKLLPQWALFLGPD